MKDPAGGAMTFGVGLMGAFAPQRFRHLVALAERLGYSDLWIADEALYRNVYALLATAALSSRSIRLGTAVTNPFTRHPALTAAAIASIDELSDGRAVLGIGAGGSAPAVLGIERDHPVEAVRDAVHIIAELTAAGRADYHGRRLSFTGALNFAPLRRVPVLIAGRGPRMMRLAGEVADGAIIGGIATPEGIGRIVSHVRGGLHGAGRDASAFEVVSWLYTSVGPSSAPVAVRRIVAASIINSRNSLDDLGITLAANMRAVLDQHDWKRSEGLIERVAALLTDDLLNVFSVTGPPESCVARIRGLSRMGVTHTALFFFPPEGGAVEEQMELFAVAMAAAAASHPAGR